MTLGISRRRARPRWAALGILVVLLLGLASTAVLAVHDAGVFQLDDNALTESKSGVNAGEDWAAVYAGTDTAAFTSFDTDTTKLGGIYGAGDNIFTGAQPGGNSKDPDPISGWRYTQSNSTSAPDKDDLEHAYTAQYIVDLSAGDDLQCGTSGDIPDCDLLYFGADRYATSGDSQLGFWFFRSEVTLGAQSGSIGGFVGEHVARNTSTGQRGDILVLSDFLQGGAAPTIRVFEWVGSGGSDGSLDLIAGTTTAPADCNGAPKPKSNATPVPAIGADDNACATVNNATTPSPWLYTPKSGTANNFPAGAFYEGGINLTALGFGDTCFSSFLAETRSSQSPTATLKDFVLGGFGNCDSSVVTTPGDGSGTALADTNDNDLPDAQLGTGSAGVDVTDSAEVAVNGINSWSGTVDFYICGPIESGMCDTGGVPAGGGNVDQSNTAATSESVNLTEVGRYCWRGDFTPSAATAAAGVEPASDASATECFEVLPVSPVLTTTAWSNGDATGSAQTADVSFGSPLYDKASLSKTANEPGNNGGDGAGNYLSINATNGPAADGTITFTLLVDDANCDTAAAGTPTTANTATVDGDGDYFSAGFTTDSPGDFTWQAVYDGSTSGNTLGTDHNMDCSDESEDVTVQQLQPTIGTGQSFVPNDSATITVASGAGNLDGYVVFKLYVDNATCEGDADYTSGQMAVSALDDTNVATISDTAESDNTVAYDTTGTTFNWVVEFVSNNGAHLGVTSDCVENSSITIDND